MLKHNETEGRILHRDSELVLSMPCSTPDAEDFPIWQFDLEGLDRLKS